MMCLKNETRGTVLAERVKVVDTFAGRFRGLMLTDSFPSETDAIILKPCNSVHTMLMRYPIDIIFIGKDNQVLHCCHNLAPGRLSPVIRGAKAVAELPTGTVGYSDTSIGDRLYIG